MSTNLGLSWVVLLAAVGLCSCGMRTQSSELKKNLPASSLQYRLKVDSMSLPSGVTARERQVPGTRQVQTWIRNQSDIPFVIVTTDREGKVVRRQKIIGNAVFLESGAPRPTTADSEWQRLEGVEEVLIALNFTPAAIVDGRTPSAGTDARVPPPEPFSIRATSGGEPAPIRGHIVYSRSPGGQR